MAITYARRYALSAMVGVCSEEDDDGEKAMSRVKKDKVIEKPEDKEALIAAFARNFPSESLESVKAYLERYSSYWKKSISTAIEDYADPNIFLKDLHNWTAQHAKRQEQAQQAQ